MTTPTQPPNYLDRAAIAADPNFKLRVKVAMMTAAIVTGFKPKAVDEADFFYKKRIDFCVGVIYGDPNGYLDAFTWALVWDNVYIPQTVDITVVYADTSANGDALLQGAVDAVFEFMIKTP